MNRTFKHFDKNDSYTSAVMIFWSWVGTVSGKFYFFYFFSFFCFKEGKNFCCGLNGYRNFNSKKFYPSPCCGENFTSTNLTDCNAIKAEVVKVEGCKRKIHNFLIEWENIYLGLTCGYVIFEVS